MSIIAIDPGKAGGIAYTLKEGETHSVPMPETSGDVLELLRTIRAICGPKTECYLEACIRYVAGNAQTGSSAIVYGRNYGFLEGCIQAIGMRLHVVRPQEWIKKLGLGTKGKMSNREWKNKLKSEAQRLFPTQTVTLKTADALLILEYANRGGLRG